MTREDLVGLVDRYFAAVDGEDLPGLLDTLATDCVFTVETHGVRLCGHDEIAGMFRRLWAAHAAVLHHDFTHVPDPDAGRIASAFKVVNTHHDGRLAHKSNCNFFAVRDGRFGSVAVYMTGVNTLDREDRK